MPFYLPQQETTDFPKIQILNERLGSGKIWAIPHPLPLEKSTNFNTNTNTTTKTTTTTASTTSTNNNTADIGHFKCRRCKNVFKTIMDLKEHFCKCHARETYRPLNKNSNRALMKTDHPA